MTPHSRKSLLLSLVVGAVISCAHSGASGSATAAREARALRTKLFDEKRKRADFIVDTSHGLDPVRAHIRDILEQVIKMPQRRS